MELKIATGITEMRGSQDDIDSVLFTGHSAGGAISQIFYAASLSPETTLSQAVQGGPTHKRSGRSRRLIIV